MTDKDKLLDQKGVIRMLRDEIKQAGSTTAWAKKTGIGRTMVSKVMSGRKPIPKSILKALGLKVVYWQCD
jgi:DNA-binding phage protein